MRVYIVYRTVAYEGDYTDRVFKSEDDAMNYIKSMGSFGYRYETWVVE